MTGELDTKVARVVGGKFVDDLPDGATNHIKYALHCISILMFLTLTKSIGLTTHKSLGMKK